MKLTYVMMAALLLITEAASAAPIQCETPLDIVGTAERMQAKDGSTIIRLRYAPLSPLSIAYGPGTDPKAEITAVDGRYHVARGENGAIRLGHGPATQGASMLVRATPRAWTRAGRLDAITNLKALDAALAARIKAMGCAGNATMPFRIAARAVSLTIGVDGVPAAATATLANVDVVIVGVYANHDQANSFMAGGLNLHPHVLVPASGLSGHVRDLLLQGGARLQLPAR